MKRKRPSGWLVFVLFVVALIPFQGTGIAWNTVIFFPIAFYLYVRYSTPHLRVAKIMLKRFYKDIFGRK